MAYLAQTNAQDDPNNQQAQGGAQGGASGPTVIDGGAGAGSPVSTAGVGAGGTGGWTNIQSYLGANKGNTYSSDMLKNTAGKEIDDNQSKLTTDAASAKDSAHKQVDENKMGQDQASKLIEDQLGGQNPNGANQIKEKLTAQYQAPKFDYSQSADLQSYGKGLTGDNTAFRGVMGSLYDKAAPNAHMSLGQTNLQNQLDQEDDGLQSAHQDLGGRYTALNKLAYGEDGKGGLVADTSKDIEDQGQAFRDNQAALSSGLGNEAADLSMRYGSQVEKFPGSAAAAKNQLADRYNAIKQALGSSERLSHVSAPPMGGGDIPVTPRMQTPVHVTPPPAAVPDEPEEQRRYREQFGMSRQEYESELAKQWTIDHAADNWGTGGRR